VAPLLQLVAQQLLALVVPDDAEQLESKLV
jgi:hypothetical protein